MKPAGLSKTWVYDILPGSSGKLEKPSESFRWWWPREPANFLFPWFSENQKKGFLTIVFEFRAWEASEMYLIFFGHTYIRELRFPWSNRYNADLRALLNCLRWENS